MKPINHTTAKASYYSSRADVYDEFNEANAQNLNAVLERILKDHNISTVLDLTCGTGSQVFWLLNAGFQVVGSDINPKMLKIAKEKARKQGKKVHLFKGDCRTIRLGHFDSVITIFNSIGHLTKEDFILTLQNISANLNSGGLYIFDIFNLDYLLHKDNISKLTIDWLTLHKGSKIREVQFSTITDDGILASYSTYIHQEQQAHPTKIVKGYANTLQVYRADELNVLLQKNGFRVLNQLDIQGQRFEKLASERILTIAQKI